MTRLCATNPDFYITVLWFECAHMKFKNVPEILGTHVGDLSTLSVFHRAKLVDVTLSLNATRYLRNETAYIPWLLAVRNFEYFHSMFDRTEVNGPMQVCLIDFYIIGQIDAL